MITRKAPAFWAIVAAIILSVPVFAAGQGRRNQQQQQQQPQQAQAPQGVGPSAQSKDEFDAFMNAQKEQDPAKKIELSEAFVAKYPNSDFILYAHTFRVSAYGQLGKPKESIAAAEQAIDATVKFGEKLLAKADADAKLSDKDKEALKKKDKNAVFLDNSRDESGSFDVFDELAEEGCIGFAADRRADGLLDRHEPSIEYASAGMAPRHVRQHRPDSGKRVQFL